jgi:hypothetical protein
MGAAARCATIFPPWMNGNNPAPAPYFNLKENTMTSKKIPQEAIPRKKQIPFRYPGSLQKDIDLIGDLQSWSPKKNLALIHAVMIAAAFLKKKKKAIKKKDATIYHEVKNAVEADLKIELPYYSY